MIKTHVGHCPYIGYCTLWLNLMCFSIQFNWFSKHVCFKTVDRMHQRALCVRYTSLWMPQNYGCCLCRPPSCLKRFVNVAFQLSVAAWGPSCKCLLVVLIANGMRPAKQVWADSLSCTSIVNHPVPYVRQSKQQSNIRRYGERGSVNLHKIEHLRSKNGFCSSIFQEF